MWWRFGYEIVGGFLIFFSSLVTEQMSESWKKRSWRIFLVAAIAYGGLGIYLDYRTDKRDQIDRKELRDNASRVSGNMDNLLRTISLAMPELNELDRKVADLRGQINAAREKHDPRLVADLEAKAEEAQQQADRVSKELQALTHAPVVAEQLRGWNEMQENRQLAVIGNENIEDDRYRRDHPDDEQGITEIAKKYIVERRKAAEQSEDDLKAIIANADSIRKELLQRVPPQYQNALDRTMEQQFTQGQHDLRGFDPRQAAAYIEELPRRVPPPK